MHTSLKLKWTQICLLLVFFLLSLFVHAESNPKFNLLPLTSPKLNLFPDQTAIVQYQVTNNTKITRTLTMSPMQGITQQIDSTSCTNPFTLAHQESCVLTLQISGSLITAPIIKGPEICKTRGPGDNRPSLLLCSQPSLTNSLSITIDRSSRLLTIDVSPATITIPGGGTQQYTATATYSDGRTRDVTAMVNWVSSFPGAAVISNQAGSAGLATGSHAGGNTTISATLYNVTGTAALTVTPATLVSIVLSPANPTIAASGSQQFIATGTYSDGVDEDITTRATWGSDTPSVAVISNNAGSQGLATAIPSVNGGQSQITASLSGISADTQLTVSPATLTSITVTPTFPSIAATTTQQFQATGTYSNNVTQDLTLDSNLTWSSSNTAVVSIGDNSSPGTTPGLATGVSAGTTVIKAAMGGKEGSTPLTVSNATLTRIEISPSDPMIAQGTTQAFIATGFFSDNSTQDLTTLVNWTSNAPLTASISTTGVATAGTVPGTAQITAIFNSISDTTDLTVTSATLTQITIAPVDPNIPTSFAQQFTATGRFSDMSVQDLTTQVNWSSSDQSIAQISNVGSSKGLANSTAVAGQTEITATLNGISDSTTLTVTADTLLSIAVTPNPTTSPLGASKAFTATGTYSSGTPRDLTNLATWTSADPSIASVSNISGSKGVAIGVSQGTVSITAAYLGLSGQASLQITPKVLTSIVLTSTPASPIPASGQAQYTATGIYSDHTTADVTTQATWSSSNTTVIVVSNSTGSKGLAQALPGIVDGGQATITASIGSVSRTSILEVNPATLTSITLTPGYPGIAVNTTQQFTATGVYSNNTSIDLTSNPNLVWSSSNQLVATIGDNSVPGTMPGLASGLAAGTTIIKAAMSGQEGSTTLSVSNATLNSISITPLTASIAVNTTQPFKATGRFSDNTTQDLTTSVTWSSSTPTVASIANSGIATGLAAGSTQISASFNTVNSDVATLTVTAATLTQINISPANATIPTSSSQQFTAIATFSDSTTQDVTTQVAWESSDPAVAGFSTATNANGLAISNSIAGQTQINASLNGVSASTSLTVIVDALTGITVSPSSISKGIGDSQSFTAMGNYSSGDRDITNLVTWTSLSPAIATISNVSGSKGVAVGQSVGTATIKAAYNSIEGTASFTVTAPTLVSILVTGPSGAISSNGQAQFTATGLYSDHSSQVITDQVTWSSSNTAIAVVSNNTGSNGLAQAIYTSVDEGQTQITATLSGISGSAGLTVAAATLDSINVTPAIPYIVTGTKQQFTATGIYNTGATKDLTSAAGMTWSSQSTNIATIGPNTGLATGVAQGTSSIKASYVTSLGNTVEGSTTLTVINATLLNIDITPAGGMIALGTTKAFTATGTFTNNITQDITNVVNWSTDPTGIVSVSNTGLATALAVGTTSITAEFQSVSTDTSIIVSNATLSSITVTPNAPSLPSNFTQQFTATGNFSDSTTQDLTTQVTWGSSNLAVASISNASNTKGLATGNPFGGQTSISATLNGVTGSTNLTVTPVTLTGITITPASPSPIPAGDTLRFMAMGTFSQGPSRDITSSVQWISSTPSVATISNAYGSNGFVASIAAGSTNITAKYGSLESPAVLLQVTPAVVVAIVVMPSSVLIDNDDQQQFTAMGTYSDRTTQDITTQVNWTSSNTDTAVVSNTVGSQGIAKPISPGTGTATITATLGVSGSATLNINAATLSAVSITPSAPTIAASTTQRFMATAIYTNGKRQDVTNSVTWTSSNLSVAGVSNGLATASGTGTTSIGASLSGFSDATPLTVNNATLTSITVTPASSTMVSGTTVPFKAQGTFSNGSKQDITLLVNWTSSNTGAATVSATTGVVNAASVGTTTITATLNSISGSTGLTVVSPPILSSLTIAPLNPTLNPSSSQQFTATGTFGSTTQDLTTLVTWSSSNPSVANISNSGLATSTPFTGQSTITAAYTYNGTTLTPNTTLTVANRTITAITIMPNNPSIGLGQSQALIATATYSDTTTQNITASALWKSATPSVASISNASGSQGIAYGLAAGSSIITAEFGSVTGQTTLQVGQPVLTAITLSPTSATIPQTGTQQYAATGLYSDYSTQNITSQVSQWTSSVPGFASINTTGLATGVAAGTTNITATATPSSGSVTSVSSPLTVTVPITIRGDISNPNSVPIIGVTLQNTVTNEQVQFTSNAQSTFVFNQPIAYGGSYNIIVSQQISGTVCSVTNGNRQNVTANVTDVLVTCSSTSFTIGGKITGLIETGLVLQNNGGNNLSPTPNSGAEQDFVFSQPVAANSSYEVTVLTQPNFETCTVNAGQGSNVQANIDTVRVICNPTAYRVGGTFTGLTADGLVLKNNGTDTIYPQANASSFTFPTPVAIGANYSVTIASQPSGLQCAVANATGTITTGPITNVAVNCEKVFAYIANSIPAAIPVSSVNVNTGQLSIIDTTVSSSLNNPRSIVIDPTSSYLYTTNNSTNGTIGFCTIDKSTGKITQNSCTTTGDATFGLCVGIALDPSATHAYITSSTSGTPLFRCDRNLTNGTLSGCVSVSPGVTLTSPSGIAVHPNGNYLYMNTNVDGSSLYRCPITNKTTGAIGTCQALTSVTFATPRRLTISPSGTYIYVTQIASSTIKYCQVNPNTGAISNCQALSGNFSEPLGININPKGTVLYATNYSSNSGTTISSCTINQSDGSFSNCILSTGYSVPLGITFTGR